MAESISVTVYVQLWRFLTGKEVYMYEVLRAVLFYLRCTKYEGHHINGNPSIQSRNDFVQCAPDVGSIWPLSMLFAFSSLVWFLLLDSVQIVPLASSRHRDAIKQERKLEGFGIRGDLQGRCLLRTSFFYSRHEG